MNKDKIPEIQVCKLFCLFMLSLCNFFFPDKFELSFPRNIRRKVVAQPAVFRYMLLMTTLPTLHVYV